MAGQAKQTVIDTTRRFEWEITKENFDCCEPGVPLISPKFRVKTGSDTSEWSKWEISLVKFPLHETVVQLQAQDKIGIGICLLPGDVTLKVEIEGIGVKSEVGYKSCEPFDCEPKKFHDIVEFDGNADESCRLCATDAGHKEDFLKMFSKNKIKIVATLRFYVDRNDYIKKNKREVNFLTRVRSISDNDTLSDFTVVCGDREFKCHRVILAAMSTVFEAMLKNSQFIENEQNSVTIENSTPVLVEAMLNFMYTGLVPDNIADMAIDLIGLANKYDLQDLIQICESSLADNMSVEFAIESLIAVDLHNPSSQHRQKMIDFIKREANDLVKSKDWKKFVKEYPDLVTEIFLSAVNAPLKVSSN